MKRDRSITFALDLLGRGNLEVAAVVEGAKHVKVRLP
jgi:hypothetical protein